MNHEESQQTFRIIFILWKLALVFHYQRGIIIIMHMISVLVISLKMYSFLGDG